MRGTSDSLVVSVPLGAWMWGALFEPVSLSALVMFAWLAFAGGLFRYLVYPRNTKKSSDFWAVQEDMSKMLSLVVATVALPAAIILSIIALVA